MPTEEKMDRLWRWSVWLSDLVGPHVAAPVRDAALDAWARGEEPPLDGKAWLQSVQQKKEVR